MDTRIHFPRAPAAAVALILLAVLGAAFAAWLALAPSAPRPEARAGPCGVCGVVEHVRVIEFAGPGDGLSSAEGGSGTPGSVRSSGANDGALLVLLGAVALGTTHPAPERLHEVAVRLDDGTLRVFRDVRAPRWQPGERVRIVGGRIRASREAPQPAR